MSSTVPKAFDDTLVQTRVFQALLVSTNFTFILIFELLRWLSVFALPEPSTFTDWIVFIAVFLSLLGIPVFFFFQKIKPYRSRPLRLLRGEPSVLALKQLGAWSISRMAVAQMPGILGVMVAVFVQNYAVFYALVALTLFLHFFAFPRRKDWERDYAGWLQFFEKHRIQSN